MALDPSFIGSVLNALPLDKMISTPLQAMITAQIQASKAYADFLMSVCIKDGKAVTVQFDYEETLVEGSNTDLATEMVQMIENEHAFAANVAALRTSMDMTGVLIDMMV